MAETPGYIVWRAPWWGIPLLKALVILNWLGIRVDTEPWVKRVVHSGTLHTIGGD